MSITPPVSDETLASLASALVRARWSGSRRRLTVPKDAASGSVTPFMDRRTFIGTLAGGLLAAPLGAEAQPAGNARRIGYLQGTSRDAQLHLVQAFEAGLREKGYVLDRDLVIEYRFAEGHRERLPELAAELVRLKVVVIVIGLEPGISAARNATTSIPIVMAGALHPVEEKFVASLARPGGNVTGLAQDTGLEIQTKRLQILREIVPTTSRIVALSGAGMSYNASQVKALEDAGRGLGTTILPLVFRGPRTSRTSSKTSAGCEQAGWSCLAVPWSSRSAPESSVSRRSTRRGAA